MKKSIAFVVLLVTMHYGKAQLSGNYTIDPGGSGSNNFTSFTAAVAALSSSGINGNTVFLVSEGTYAEQIAIPEISGTNASDSIVFKADVSNTSNVILEYPVTCPHNYVVKVNGADYVTFRNIEIVNSGSSSCGISVLLTNDANHFNLIQCSVESEVSAFIDSNAAIYSTGPNDSLLIADCEIVGGRTGVYYEGSSSSHSQGLKLMRSAITDHTLDGVKLVGVDHVVIYNNQITSDSLASIGADNIGLDLIHSDNFIIKANRIGTDANVAYRRGARLYSAIGTNLNRSKIINNCIQAGREGYTSAGSGLEMHLSGLIDIFHNTLRVKTSATNSMGLGIYSGGGIKARNNIIGSDSGYAMIISSAFFTAETDNNVYYSAPNMVIYQANTAYATLEDYVSASQLDSGSIEHTPVFENGLECLLCDELVENSAEPILEVTHDLYGNTRSVLEPDPGCTEFIDADGSFLGSDTVYCENEVELILGGAMSVTWSVNGNASAGESVALENTTCSSVTFQVSATVTTENCGTGNDQVQITLIPRPNLISDSHFCQLDSFVLEACGDSIATYQWSTGSTASSIQVSQGGVYSLIKTEGGCTMQDTVEITASAVLTIEDIEDCVENAPISIDGSLQNAVSYSWSGGLFPNNPINYFDSSGTYSLMVQDGFECTLIDSFILYLLDDPTPAIDYINSGFTFVFDASNSLYLSPGSTVSWNFGNNGAVPNSSTTVTQIVQFPWSGLECLHEVTLEIENVCGTGVATTLLDFCTGLENVEQTRRISLYPNPVTDAVHYEVKLEDLGSTVEYVDQLGQVIRREKITSPIGVLDVSDFALGIYIVRLANHPTEGMRLIVH
ncbi:MAG: T9SS type A sorting domain-containing protein [Cryomorphaceae bacterium]